MDVFKVWCRTRWVRCTIDGPFISFEGTDAEWIIHDVRKMADAIVEHVHGHWLNNFENWKFKKPLHPNAKEWAARKFRSQMTKKVGPQIWEKAQRLMDPTMFRLSALAYAYDKTLARFTRGNVALHELSRNQQFMVVPIPSLRNTTIMRTKMSDPLFIQQVVNNCDGWKALAQLGRHPDMPCETFMVWLFGTNWKSFMKRIQISPGLPLYALSKAVGGGMKAELIPYGATQTELKWVLAHHTRHELEQTNALLAMRAKDIRLEMSAAYIRFSKLKKRELPKYIADRKIKSIHGFYSIDAMRWAMDTYHPWMDKRK